MDHYYKSLAFLFFMTTGKVYLIIFVAGSDFRGNKNESHIALRCPMKIKDNKVP